MYDKSLSSGKALVFMGASAEETEVLLKRYGKERMFIHSELMAEPRAEELAALHAGL